MDVRLHECRDGRRAVVWYIQHEALSEVLHRKEAIDVCSLRGWCIARAFSMRLVLCIACNAHRHFL